MVRAAAAAITGRSMDAALIDRSAFVTGRSTVARPVRLSGWVFEREEP
jgi:hypothetical protein